MKKKLQIIITSVLLVICCSIQMIMPVFAETYSISKSAAGKKTISPTNSMINKTTTQHTGKTIQLNGQNSNYNLSIFKFSLNDLASNMYIRGKTESQQGWVDIYTTPNGRLNNNTVGKIVQKGSLFSGPIAITGEIGSNNSDFFITQKLTGQQTYYMCVRSYDGTSSNYSLHIEPHVDKKYSPKGGTWIVNTADRVFYYSCFCEIRKEYHDKEWVKAYYNLLTNLEQAIRDEIWDFEHTDRLGLVKNLYEEGVLTWDILSVFLELNPAVEILVALSKFATETAYSEIVDALYGFSDVNEIADERGKLRNICGCGKKGNAYYADSGVCFTYVGCVVNGKYYNQPSKNISAWNTQSIYGANYEKGYFQSN